MYGRTIVTIQRSYSYLALFVLHFDLVVTISCQQTFWILALGYTGCAHSLERYWLRAAEVTTIALGQDLSLSSPVQTVLTGYLHATGIKRRNGFFASDVARSNHVIFD